LNLKRILNQADSALEAAEQSVSYNPWREQEKETAVVRAAEAVQVQGSTNTRQNGARQTTEAEVPRVPTFKEKLKAMLGQGNAVPTEQSYNQSSYNGAFDNGAHIGGVSFPDSIRCALPGCAEEGKFKCTGCDLTRYCGEPHQLYAFDTNN
jgi:hypothetical protein